MALTEGQAQHDAPVPSDGGGAAPILTIVKDQPREPDLWRFPGFTEPGYTQVPNELFDELMDRVSDIELRVLLYIIRRTFGFQKNADTISLTQMVIGIKTRDGEVLDRGTGLSRPSVIKAVRGLEGKQILVADRSQAENGGQATTLYRLFMREGVVNGVNQGGKPRLLGVVNGVNQGVVNPVYPQKKEVQKKENNTGREEVSPPSKGMANPESAAAEQKLPPPSPSASLVAVPGLDPGSRKRTKAAAATNGWSEYPDRLESLKRGLRERWQKLPVKRWSEQDLELVASCIAPDEADRFKKATEAYLASDEVSRGIVYSLRRWLSEAWKEWKPSPVAQRGAAALYVTPAQEIAMLSKMTGRKFGT